MCTWVADRYGIPLTIIRICSTYGPEGGAPADRLDAMLAGKPIRLHPDKPNNYNPIYEDDYVELGIRAMEVAATPPSSSTGRAARPSASRITAPTWASSSASSPSSSTPPDAHTPLWPDVTHMHEVLGSTKVPWREGFRRMIAARHPEIDLTRGTELTLPGTPSDDVDGVLAAGRGEIGTLFVSMARRHPDGHDAEYLRWHTLDHRPEQHRLAGVRASLRLVSTPACRAARRAQR